MLICNIIDINNAIFASSGYTTLQSSAGGHTGRMCPMDPAHYEQKRKLIFRAFFKNKNAFRSTRQPTRNRPTQYVNHATQSGDIKSPHTGLNGEISKG